MLSEPHPDQPTCPSNAAPPATPAGWYIACRSFELKRSPLGLRIAAHSLVFFRDEQGQPAALDDRCAHRNAPLSAGKVCDGRLRCAYHGWEYTAQGELARIPALPTTVVATHIRVAHYVVEEKQGFVWVWLPNAIQPAPGAGAPLFPHYKEPGWTSFVMHTRFEGNVEACLENFLDCPHATFVHRYWFRSPTAKPVKCVVRTLADGAEAEYFEEPREKSLVWWALAPARGNMRHTDRFIAPNTSQVDYAFPGGLHYTITSSCTPIHSNATQVTTVISFRYKKIGFLVRLFFEPLSRLIIRQDVKMLRLQAQNIQRFGKAEFRSTPADLLGPHIVAWRHALSRGEPVPQEAKERDVEIFL